MVSTAEFQSTSQRDMDHASSASSPSSSSRRRDQGKNIWIAASDGDLERVKDWIENHDRGDHGAILPSKQVPIVKHFVHRLTYWTVLDLSSASYNSVQADAEYYLTGVYDVAWNAYTGLSPNIPDENTYTPMHAAASYAHLELLDYLISKGGNINITDEDGDTPLFTVESKEIADALIQRGADIHWRNQEGQTAAEYLFEDNPEVAIYLQSLALPQAASGSGYGLDVNRSAAGENANAQSGSAFQTEQLSSRITDDLISQTGQILEDAERTGENPDQRLRELVGRAVMGGWAQQQTGPGSEGESTSATDQDSKRRREED